MNLTLSDGGTYTCILSTDTAEEVSEEHVTVTVFDKVEDTEIRHREISRTMYPSYEDFDVKYLKYQVKVNFSRKHKLSYFALFCCLLVNSSSLIGR